MTELNTELSATQAQMTGTLAKSVWKATIMVRRPSAEKVSPKIIRRRRSYRSASTPPNGDNSSDGRKAASVTSDTAVLRPDC
jgi:hypothetical protein